MDKRLLSFDKFKDHCNDIFNNKYDYSKSEYIGMKHPIKIICPIHGEFTQKAHSHYLGHQCFRCSGSKKMNNEDIIKQFIKKHEDKYDYSKVDYKNNKTNVEIICSIHGSFYQSPYEHKKGQGCPKCSKNRRLNNDMFIDIANDIHDFAYKYSGDYINSKTKVSIICSKHGSFLMTPNHHLKGQGCPDCKRSLGELLIKKYLNNRKIKYEQQKFFKDLTNNNKRYLFFDFYLLDLNICIEYDGIQHFKPVSNFGGETSFKKLKNNDRLKDEYCNLRDIKLIRIPYTSIKDISIILDKEI
jgi:hypothetical protein